MKSKVHFSTYCIIITAVVIAALLAGIVATLHGRNECLLITAIAIISIFAGLYYCPVSITADSDSLKVHRLLSGDKVFKYTDIKAIDTCYPSAGGIRLCGSGGFFGYWGYFSDIMIGQYFGYYADRSQCFYIRLKNNRRYVLSCANHLEMVRTIQHHLQ